VKVVYVGPLGVGSTCYARLKALETLCYGNVFAFDSDPYFCRPIGKWLNAIERRVFIGPRFCQSNFDLRMFCRDKRPDVVWIDKGFWIWPSTLRVLREKEAFLVHHNTDSLSPGFWHTQLAYLLMRRTLPLFNLYFTTNIVDYRALSGKEKPHTELTFLGYDHRRFDNSPLPVSLGEQWKNELLFVGHYEPHTEHSILALVEAGLPVTVYGEGWERAKERDRLHGYVKFRTLNDEEYLYALKSTKIGLCFVSELNGNQTAGRSFEFPACGTFLLAMRTKQHMECYTEGKEAEFFGNHQELVHKARYYLEHDDQRKEIARLGHQRCVRSDYSWARYMCDDWDKVLEAMDERRKGDIGLSRCGSTMS
jgi:spore maturation protein CgeB